MAGACGHAGSVITIPATRRTQCRPTIQEAHPIALPTVVFEPFGVDLNCLLATALRANHNLAEFRIGQGACPFTRQTLEIDYWHYLALRLSGRTEVAAVSLLILPLHTFPSAVSSALYRSGQRSRKRPQMMGWWRSLRQSTKSTPETEESSSTFLILECYRFIKSQYDWYNPP